MKKLTLIMLVLLLASGSAFASFWPVDTDSSGGYYLEADKWFNANLATDNVDGDKDDQVKDGGDDPAYDDSYYEHTFWFKWVAHIEDRTKVIMEAHVHGDDAGTEDDMEKWGNDDEDDLEIEFAWIEHTFQNGWILKAGEMHSGCWATSFADDDSEAHRLMGKKKINDKFTIIGIAEKNTEKSGLDTYSDGYDGHEKDDTDTYYLAAVIELNDKVTLKPRIVQRRHGDALNSTNYLATLDALRSDDDDSMSGDQTGDANDNDMITNKIEIGIEGTFNDKSGFEAELGWHMRDWSSRYFNSARYQDQVYQADEADVWGLYFNAWTDLDSGRIGGIFVHGTCDEESGMLFQFGDDFEFARILGDEFDQAYITGPAVYYRFAYDAAIDAGDDAADAAQAANDSVISARKSGSVAVANASLSTGGDLAAQTAIQIYGEIPMNDKWKLNLALSWMTSNIELEIFEWQNGVDPHGSGCNCTSDDVEVGDLIWRFNDKTDMWELDFESIVKLTEAVEWLCGISLASIDYGQPGMVDPEDIWLIWWALAINW